MMIVQVDRNDEREDDANIQTNNQKTKASPFHFPIGVRYLQELLFTFSLYEQSCKLFGAVSLINFSLTTRRKQRSVKCKGAFIKSIASTHEVVTEIVPVVSVHRIQTAGLIDNDVRLFVSGSASSFRC